MQAFGNTWTFQHNGGLPNSSQPLPFQSIDRVFNPLHISRNPRYVAVLPARKVDLSGRTVPHVSPPKRRMSLLYHHTLGGL